MWSGAWSSRFLSVRIQFVSAALGLAGLALQPVGLLCGGHARVLGRPLRPIRAAALALLLGVGGRALVGGARVAAMLGRRAVLLDPRFALPCGYLVGQPVALGPNLGLALLDSAARLALTGLA